MLGPGVIGEFTMNIRRRPLARVASRASAAFALLLASFPAKPATLVVGPGRGFLSIREAALRAHPGDTVRVEPGVYHDCAVWRVDGLTIEGTGAGARFEDTVCEDKGIFVVLANDVTIRNISFAHARSSDGNGAGIRAQGRNLTVDEGTFVDNEDGILSDTIPESTILIRNSNFVGNGSCISPSGCAHGIYIGHIARLRVEGSHFWNTRIGHHIKSRALRTEIANNIIEDGPLGTSSYLIDVPNGGSVEITGNRLEKGSLSDNHVTAIDIGEEGKLQPGDRILISRNRFDNDGPPTVFVRNASTLPAELAENVLRGHQIEALVGPGQVH